MEKMIILSIDYAKLTTDKVLEIKGFTDHSTDTIVSIYNTEACEYDFDADVFVDSSATLEESLVRLGYYVDLNYSDFVENVFFLDVSDNDLSMIAEMSKTNRWDEVGAFIDIPFEVEYKDEQIHYVPISAFVTNSVNFKLISTFNMFNIEDFCAKHLIYARTGFKFAFWAFLIKMNLHIVFFNKEELDNVYK